VYTLGYHLVWCAKYRRPVLAGEVGDRLDAILREKAAEHDWTFGALQVMPDHVHALVSTRPADSPAFIANQLKGSSSRMLRAEFPHLKSRLPTLWSRSFFIATVGSVSQADVAAYIETQWERPWRKDSA